MRINRHDEIDELIARIYLDTRIKLSKKELLELIFDIGYQDYELLLNQIQGDSLQNGLDSRSRFIEEFSGILELDDEEIDPKSIWEKHLEVE